MNRLVISLATRGRPQQAVETIKRSVENWTHPETQMQVQIDDDDHPTIEAMASAGIVAPTGSGIFINQMPREDSIAEKWNRCLEVPADVYLIAANDDPYVTLGYDTKILEAAERFPDGIGYVYGHLANLSFTGAVAVTRKMADLMGYIFPPYFPYWFVDHWTDDVARITQRISFANIRTDQSKVGKTQEMREPGWWATFFDACYLMRRAQAHAIIDSPDFQCEAWHKNLLKTGHPLIELRSRMINHSVRAQSKQLEGWSGLKEQDERYKRIKQRAIDMLPHVLGDFGMPEEEAAMFRRYLVP